MKPLPDKDGNAAGWWDSVYRFHPGKGRYFRATDIGANDWRVWENDGRRGPGCRTGR